MLDLFLSFLSVGVLSFGGGMVSISLMYRQAVVLRSWLAPETFNDLIAIAEATPGPIAVNAATFTGMRLYGLPGALLATAAAVLPGCAAALALSSLYARCRRLGPVQGVMDGLKPVTVALIFAGGLTMLKTALLHGLPLLPANVDGVSAASFAACLVILRRTRLSPVALMLAAGAAGAAFRLPAG